MDITETAPDVDMKTKGMDAAQTFFETGREKLPEAESLTPDEKRHFIDGFGHVLMEKVEDEKAFWDIMLDVSTEIGWYMLRDYGNWMTSMFGKKAYCSANHLDTYIHILDRRQQTRLDLSLRETQNGKVKLKHDPQESAGDEPWKERMQYKLNLICTQRYWAEKEGKPPIVKWMMPASPNGHDPVVEHREAEDKMQNDYRVKIERCRASDLYDDSIEQKLKGCERELDMRKAIHDLLPGEWVIGNQRIVGAEVSFKNFRQFPEVRQLVYEIARYLVLEKGYRVTHIATMDVSSPD